MRRNLTSFKIIGPLFFLSKEGKKTFFKKKLKAKKMQSGGINLYVKLVLMTTKIKFYFWKKKGFVTLCIKKKCENLIILEKYMYRGLVSAVCMYSM